MKSHLFQYTLALADDQLILGHRLSEWIGQAPVLEEELALGNIGLDLIGAARSLYTYAGEVEGQVTGNKGRDEDKLAYLRDAPAYRNCLLAELPNGRNVAGNDWPSFCAGPGLNAPAGLSPDCVQLSKASTFNNISYGSAAYGLHARRFNYLFHDGHVQAVKMTDTVGKGTVTDPKGMWTIAVGD